MAEQVFRTGDSITTDYFSFPTQDGTLGQVLTTDGAGGITWENQGGATSPWTLDGSGNLHAGAGTGSFTTGTQNFIAGNGAGNITSGLRNVIIGQDAANDLDSSLNVILGYNAMDGVPSGDWNVVLGSETAVGITGSMQEMILIGHAAGPATNTSYSKELYIDIQQTDTPLIWGDFDADQVDINGVFQVKNTAGIMYVIDDTTAGGNAGAYYGMRDSNNANLGGIGFVTADGNMRINVESLAGGNLELRPATGAVEQYHQGSGVTRTVATLSGGLQVNNTSTGGGWERVLTTSDLGGGGLFSEDANDNIVGGTGAAPGIGATGAPRFIAGTGAGSSATSGLGRAIVIGNDAAAGAVSIGQGDDSVVIGYQAAQNGLGNSNVVIGYQAMNNAASATNQNVAVGYQAMLNANVIADSNVAVGYSALSSNTSGDDNVAVGWNALDNTTTGTRNVALGYQAGLNVTTNSSDNIFIGNNAGPATSGSVSNELYIDNSTTDTPLIHGDFSANEVTINGDLDVTGVFNIGGTLAATAPSASNASANFPLGPVGPSFPSDGDMWATAGEFNVQNNGTTYNLLAPASTSSPFAIDGNASGSSNIAIIEYKDSGGNVQATVGQTFNGNNLFDIIGHENNSQIRIGTDDPAASGAATFTTGINGQVAAIISTGLVLEEEADLRIKESSDHNSTVVAGSGYIWVRDDNPTTLMYTDDNANDYEIGGVGAGGNWALLATVTPTATGNIDISWDEAAYSSIRVELDAIQPATDGVTFRCQVGSADGATIHSSASDYDGITQVWEGTGGYSALANNDFIDLAQSCSDAANETVSGVIEIKGGRNADVGAIIKAEIIYINSVSNLRVIETKAFTDDNVKAAIDTLRLFYASGNHAATGDIKIYGLRR